MTKGVDIFISYRRVGGRDIARNVTERLILKGFNTFFDYDSMRDGKFNDQIYHAIDQCKDFVLILSPGALDRCCNSDDWVRAELEYALSRNKHIILLATEGFENFPDNLPDELSDLRLIQFHYLDNRFYEASMKSLIADLHSARLKKRICKAACVSVLVMMIGVMIAILINHRRDSIFMEICLATAPEIEDVIGVPIEHIFDASYCYASEDRIVKPISDYISFDRELPITIASAESFPHFLNNPVFKIVLKNNGTKTQIVSSAEIQVSNVTIIRDSLYRVLYDDSYLTIDVLTDIDCDSLIVESNIGRYPFRNIISKRQCIKVGEPLHLPYDMVNEELFGFAYDKCGRQIISFEQGTENTEMIEKSDMTTCSSIPSYIIDIMSQCDTFKVHDFMRTLQSGDWDDEVMFCIECSTSCEFDLKVSCETINGQKISSDTWRVYYFKPNYPNERLY